MYERHMFGYVSVDFVAFKDPNNADAHPLFWAIDIDFHMTDACSISSFYNFLLDGKMDSDFYNYKIATNEINNKNHYDEIEYENRYVLYIP